MSGVYRYSYLFLIILGFQRLGAQTLPITISRTNEVVRIISSIEYLEDAGHNLTPENVAKSINFKVNPSGIPNFGINNSVFWVRLKIKNETDHDRFILKIANPLLDSLEFFEPMANGPFRRMITGESVPFSKKEYISSDYLFSFNIQPHSEQYVYLRVSNSGAILLPLVAGTDRVMLDSDKYKDIFWGLYIGLMLAMLLYNCFVYITTRDKSYLYYIAYVLTVIITQITLSGFGFQLLWPGNVWFATHSAFLTPPLVGIAGMEFMRHFLKTKQFVPRADKFFFVLYALYGVAVCCSFLGKYSVGFTIMDMTALSVSIYMLAIAIVISLKGYRPAIFFLISWIAFLIGVFVFVFKNFNILPYNNFTIYTMPVGSAMEVILLSFALADRINILKKEKEESQAATMLALQENERIVLEQNVMLERKVDERTYELKVVNDDLNTAMVELKEAETQLVESEKMASLGQLTAGIAHEINNPINFVTSNVKPLNRDVRILLEVIDEIEKIMVMDIPAAAKQKKTEEYKTYIDFDYLKEEIEQLLSGIGEGASRTAEIVKGLRIFSRLDEDDLKKADINEGLESTLVITNNMMNNIIKVERNYGNLPLIECYPGKLNQVFLNIISNGVYAIRKKFGEADGGVISIITSYDDHHVIVKMADNGTGMDENTRKRLFEPFFTTKDVGEGTGLGLSIAYNTINKHNGQIQVNSEVGKGTEFIIILPLIQK